MKHAENRLDERFACGSPVEWAYFNRSEKHSGRMRNYSSQGACIECRQALIQGATIVLRIKSFDAGCRSSCREGIFCPWPRSIALGVVKWCQSIADDDPFFGAGIKFLNR